MSDFIFKISICNPQPLRARGLSEPEAEIRNVHQGLVNILKNALISRKVSVKKRIPIIIMKIPLMRVTHLIYRLILSNAERNALKAREERKKGMPSPKE